MYPFDRHDRLRRDLAAYLDGELKPADSTKVAGHLQSCAECSRQLEELQEASRALSDLPATEVPRSFALTPEMVRDAPQASARPPAPGHVTGLRYAAAGLAVALAVVLVADRADFASDDDGGSQESAFRIFDGNGDEQVGTNRSMESPIAAEADAGADSQYQGGSTGQGAVPAPDATFAPAATGLPRDDGSAPQADTAESITEGATDADSDAASNDTTEASDQTGASDSSGGDGWLTLELVLAVLLGASLIGIVFTSFARRREP